MEFENKFLELKVDFGRLPLEFSQPMTSFDFADLSEQVSYYPIGIQLFENDETYENQQLIATLNGFYYDLDYIHKYDIGLFDVLDMVSGDTNRIFDILIDKDGYVKKEFQEGNINVFYLDRIYTEERYRNKGYAKLLLNQIEDLIRIVLKLNAGIIVVCAQPFERDKDGDKMIRKNKELTDKLVKLYETAGFVQLQTKEPYLMKIVEDE